MSPEVRLSRHTWARGIVTGYAYDHRGRMVRKEILPTSTNSTFSILHSTFVWDAWNIIREKLTTNDYALTTSYVWGLDIDGTLQGAGGVGGLLAVIRSEPATNNSSLVTRSSSLYFPAYDANGNVTEYVSTSGDTVAHYEYSAFGEPTVSSGELASSFTHQFSTRPYCVVTGFSEYVYRKYRLNIGRWMSRDPIGEYYNYNAYIGMLNDDVSRIDYLGLSPYDDLSEKIRSAFNSAKEARAAAERCINSLKKPSERRQVGYNDKLNHCISSCEISRNCGETIADALGCIKEARDLWAGKIQQLVWPLVPLDWEEFVYDNLQGGTFQDSVDDFIANFTGFDCKNDQSGCECCCKRKMQ